MRADGPCRIVSERRHHNIPVLERDVRKWVLNEPERVNVRSSRRRRNRKFPHLPRQSGDELVRESRRDDPRMPARYLVAIVDELFAVLIAREEGCLVRLIVSGYGHTAERTLRVRNISVDPGRVCVIAQYDRSVETENTRVQPL